LGIGKPAQVEGTFVSTLSFISWEVFNIAPIMHFRFSATILLLSLSAAVSASGSWYLDFQHQVEQRLEKRLLVNPLNSPIKGWPILNFKQKQLTDCSQWRTRVRPS
jgi:hypothetical protein